MSLICFLPLPTAEINVQNIAGMTTGRDNRFIMNCVIYLLIEKMQHYNTSWWAKRRNMHAFHWLSNRTVLVTICLDH